MDKNTLLSDFWVGAHYYRAPSPPPAEWEEDLTNCRTLGLGLLQVRVFWRWHERHEGEYFWEDLDRFMDLAHNHGHKVVLQLNLENAPEYIFQKYDGYRIDIRGNRIYPTANAAFYVGGWIPCFDHPDVMAAALRFTGEMTKRYMQHPALAFYHAWNEPRCRPMGECACPHSVASYRKYLEEKYGSIEKLNEKSGKCWGDFSQVDAARDTSDFTEMFMWRQWGASRVKVRVKQVYDCIRGIDSEHAIISHVGCSGVFQDPLCDISDDIAMSDVADLYGTSFPTRLMPEYHSFMQLDWIRYVCNGNHTVYEIYPSMGQYMPEMPPGILQQWIWESVASGAKGLCFWQYKKERLGVETNDAGLVELDGSFNPNSLAVAESMQIIEKLRPQINRWRMQPSEAAICYDLRNDLCDRLEYTRTRDADYLGGYGLTVSSAWGSPGKTNMHGVYNLLWQDHFQVDYTSPARWEKDGEDQLRGYKAVVLAGFPIVDENRSRVLADYVRNGGTLIVDGGFGRRGDHTMLNTVTPGCGLHKVFGFREKYVTHVSGKCWDLSILGIPLRAHFERVEYEADEECEIIGRWSDNDAPAAIRRKVGKGTVIALGTMPGLGVWCEEGFFWQDTTDHFGCNWHGDDPEGWLKLYRRLLNDASCTADTVWNHPGIAERTMQDSDGRKIRFAFRRFDSLQRPNDAEWQKISLPGAEILAELSDVKIFASL